MNNNKIVRTGNNNGNSTLAAAISRPYRIFQVGIPRTGSTFQFELLCGIVRWKSGNKKVPCGFIRGFFKKGKKEMSQYIKNSNESFVYKVHPIEGQVDLRDEILEDFARNQSISLFLSGEKLLSNHALYTQSMENLYRCPTCEVQQYANFFGLSTDEVSQLETHMTLFGVLRQCCGLQMSKYEMQRLHGCDVNKTAPEYPHCEKYDLADVEDSFSKSPIPFNTANPKFNWVKPGDCSKFREKVKEGRGFNRKKFTGCMPRSMKKE